MTNYSYGLPESNAGDIVGYTDRHLIARIFLLVTFLLSLIATPIVLLSIFFAPLLKIAFCIGLLALVSLLVAVYQVVSAQLTWNDIQKDVAQNRLNDDYS